jgi:hypothetical protein
MTGPRPKGRPWTSAEDAQLLELIKAKMDRPSIARKLKRTVRAIASKHSKGEGEMSRRRITKNYTIQAFQIGPDQSEIDLLMINFQAENLSTAQARAMSYAMDDSFMSDIHGVKLIRNNAESWRWQKGQSGAG